MKLSHNQRGSMNVLLIPLILSVILFFGALGFGAWAYTQMVDYRDNSDQKSTAAVKVAEDKLSTKKDNEFLEREKNPLRDYKSPSVFGNISFSYPKTWSGYSTDTQEKLTLLMSPGIVSGNTNTNYAVQLSVDPQSYDQKIKSYESLVKSGDLKASAFRLEKLPNVLGSRFDGQITKGVKGSIVLLPLRDKTIVAMTESEDYLNDFNSIVLKTFTYSP